MKFFRVKNERGSVLVLALWVMIFFGMMVAVLSARVNSQLGVIRRISEPASGRILAYSGTGYVRGLFMEKKPGQTPKLDANGKEKKPLLSYDWSNNPSIFRNISLYDGANSTFSIVAGGKSSDIYGVMDEESKININTISEDIFKKIYASIQDLTGGDAELLAKETIKYREQKGRFDSVEELLLVPSATAKVLEQLKSYLTVFGGGQVNLNTVSKSTLMVLGIDGSLAERILEYRETHTKETREADESEERQEAFTGLGDLTQKVHVNAEEEEQLQNVSGLWGAASNTFRFYAMVQTPDGRVRGGFDCVINRKGDILFLANA